MKVKIDQKKKDLPIEAKDEEGKVDYGTRWPSTIGRKDKPNDDGLIRDSRGIVM